MEIDAFYGLPFYHLAKLLWGLVFLPAFVVVVVMMIRDWRGKSWRPTAAVTLLFAAHVAYSLVAGYLVAPDELRARWYEPRHGVSDAPKFIDDPTPPGQR